MYIHSPISLFAFFPVYARLLLGNLDLLLHLIIKKLLHWLSVFISDYGKRMKNVLNNGNYDNKYTTKNPIYSYFVQNFLDVFQMQLGNLESDKILKICEVGCGDGVLLKILQNNFPSANISACDISPRRIEQSKENCAGIDIDYSIQDAQDLNQYQDAQFDLVICCEVLEHVQNPYKSLAELERITSDYLFLSVPHEPIWRLLNLLRGKYLLHFGNTPAHVNHWNLFSFNKFITQARKLTIIKNLFPFPWLMKIIKKKND